MNFAMYSLLDPVLLRLLLVEAPAEWSDEDARAVEVGRDRGLALLYRLNETADSPGVLLDAKFQLAKSKSSLHEIGESFAIFVAGGIDDAAFAVGIGHTGEHWGREQRAREGSAPRGKGQVSESEQQLSPGRTGRKG